MSPHNIRLNSLTEALQKKVASQLDHCLFGITRIIENRGSDDFNKRSFSCEKVLKLANSQADRASLKCTYRVQLAPNRDELIEDATSFSIRYRSGKNPIPIVRVEFERDAHSKPKTHFHMHSDSVPFALLLARAGLHQQAGHQQDVHFPMGAHHFRVCLEDMIELSITELGATGLPGWEEHVARGRHQYWQNHVQSVTTEELPTVITTLESQGFTIIPPPDFDPSSLAA